MLKGAAFYFTHIRFTSDNPEFPTHKANCCEFLQETPFPPTYFYLRRSYPDEDSPLHERPGACMGAGQLDVLNAEKFLDWIIIITKTASSCHPPVHAIDR